MPRRGGSRGRKKPSIHDLSRQPGSHSEFMSQIDDDSDRAVALVIGSMFAQTLKDGIESYLETADQSHIVALFDENNAPLGTFYARILLARALNFIDSDEQDNLDCIRRIRNAFAHSTKAISFSTPEIEAECAKLTMLEVKDWDPDDADFSDRARFQAASFRLDLRLTQRRADRWDAKTDTLRERLARPLHPDFQSPD